MTEQTLIALPIQVSGRDRKKCGKLRCRFFDYHDLNHDFWCTINPNINSLIIDGNRCNDCLDAEQEYKKLQKEIENLQVESTAWMLDRSQ